MRRSAAHARPIRRGSNSRRDATGPALVLPLRAADKVAGVLVALRPVGAPPFSAEQLDMMSAFADQAALAWQLASTQRQMRELEHPHRPRPDRTRPA